MQTLILLITLFFTPPTEGVVSTTSGYAVGDVATDFSLPNVDGTNVSLADFPSAKGFIVVFTCNTCPYSVAYEDRIIALDEQFKTKGYPVIAINPNDPAAKAGEEMEAMQERAREKGFTFPYLQDIGQTIYPQYGATRTPHVYILEKQGSELKVAYIGAIDDSSRDAGAVQQTYVADAVEALLAGNKPQTTQTKAIGCSIKTL